MSYGLKRLCMLMNCIRVIYPGTMVNYLRILNKGITLTDLWSGKMTCRMDSRLNGTYETKIAHITKYLSKFPNLRLDAIGIQS